MDARSPIGGLKMLVLFEVSRHKTRAKTSIGVFELYTPLFSAYATDG